MAIAKRARTRYLNSITADENKQGLPLIAGSVGSYGACLHDSSEYTGKYVDYVSKEEMRSWHLPRIKALLETGVDILACETIPAQVIWVQAEISIYYSG